MAETTGIAWTDSTWNPIYAIDRQTGKRGWFCVHASDGCKSCYAEVLNGRLGNGVPYVAQAEPSVSMQLSIHGQTDIEWPVRTRRPRRIFVCSMTDLFGEFVPDEFIAAVFRTMEQATHHTFQVCTKRAARMRRWVKAHQPEPLPNVWLGVTAEDQRNADERIPLLLETPAAIRWVSYEPALGPVDFTRIERRGRFIDALSGDMWAWAGQWAQARLREVYAAAPSALDWIVVGGESGPDARPFHIEWAAETVRQCKAAGVACFVKQIGARPSVFDPNPMNPERAEWKPRDSHGSDMEEWPEDIRVRSYPQ